MPNVDQDSLVAIQPELTSGESVLWAGRPSTRVLFHGEDAYLIPFSLLWGGFALFWELGVAGYWGFEKPQIGSPVFMLLWGIPFVVVGQYMIWGRFVCAVWKKKRTHYAVTNRRVIVVQDGWKHKVASAYIDTIPSLMKENRSREFGTLRFAQETMWSGRDGWALWDRMAIRNVPTFMDIEDVDFVYRLVSGLREKVRET
jgi:hypothetical protein